MALFAFFCFFKKKKGTPTECAKIKKILKEKILGQKTYRLDVSLNIKYITL